MRLPAVSRWQIGIIAAIVVASAPSAFAADANGNFAMKGIGVLSCRDFVEARTARSPMTQRFRDWLNGYLTAANLYEQGTYDAAPWGTGEVFATIVENYCATSPDENYAQAAQRLVLTLKQDRLVRSSPLQTVTANGQSTQIYREVLRRVQVQLAERGLYTGKPDGLYGPQTEQAIAFFQISEGLDGTGLPDPLTVWKLLRP